MLHLFSEISLLSYQNISPYKDWRNYAALSANWPNSEFHHLHWLVSGYSFYYLYSVLDTSSWQDTHEWTNCLPQYQGRLTRNPCPWQFSTVFLWLIYMCDGLGYPPLSHLVARRWLSSRMGLGYRRHASTHLLKCIANGGPQGSHLYPTSNGASVPAQSPHMRALPKFSIKVVHTAPRGSLFS